MAPSRLRRPAFVSTLAICIVFVPVLLLTGAAKYLFTPLAMAVVFAMMASYFLSRTLIPTMVHYMLRSEVKLYARGEHEEGGTGLIWKAHYMFNRRFELMRASYSSLLHWCLDHRLPVLGGFFLFVAGSLCLAPLIGRDFFPTVDSGAMRLHARAPSGTRLEKTEQIFAEIENEIRQVVPPREIENIIDNIGIPNGGFNLAFGDSPTLGVSDGDILISLKPEEHGSTAEYTDRLRKRLNEKFPDVVFFFEAANITNQILNFGLPAPIDVQVVWRNAASNYEIARQIAAKVTLDSRRRRRPHSPGGGLPRDRSQRGPQQGRTGGADAARRGHQPADLAQLQRADRAHSVPRLAHRRQLRHRRADAAIPHGFAGRALAYAGERALHQREQHYARLRAPVPPTRPMPESARDRTRRPPPTATPARPQAARSCSLIWFPWAAASPRKSSTTTMCSR